MQWHLRLVARCVMSKQTCDGIEQSWLCYPQDADAQFAASIATTDPNLLQWCLWWGHLAQCECEAILCLSLGRHYCAEARHVWQLSHMCDHLLQSQAPPSRPARTNTDHTKQQKYAGSVIIRHVDVCCKWQDLYLKGVDATWAGAQHPKMLLLHSSMTECWVGPVYACLHWWPLCTEWCLN